ncbi:PA domain-containing protein [Lutibacter sp.]
MKNKFLFFLILFFAVFLIYNFNNSKSEKTKTTIVELRKQHEYFLKNSPFKKTLQLSKKERKIKGIPPNKYFERQWELTMDPATGKPQPERLFALQESLRLKNTASKVPGSAVWNNWEERGPNNVGGRTRAIMFDPNDVTNKRVFAGGVSGGLWVNNDITNEDSSWEIVDMPQNLAISVITYDPNNTNVFYLGTGESYVAGGVNGNGLWKSVDGGTNWSKVFGGITGETTFQTNLKLIVNSPSSIIGEYQVTSAAFGPRITSITGNLVLSDDSSLSPTEACNTLTNNAAISGNIAVVERGSCTFVSKVKNAQDAGAIAVIVVNNVIGPPISLGGDDSTITIPSTMISKEEGALIMQQLENGVNVTIEAVDSPFSGSFVTPGIQHINDIKVRDIGGGNSEVYVAVGESYYSNSAPISLLGVQEYGLYKSDNEGVSWSEVILPTTVDDNKYVPNDIEIGFDNTIWVSTNNSILFGDGGGTILSSTDGNTFTVKHTIANGDRTQISVSKLDASIVYILAELGSEGSTPIYLAKTDDAFATVNELTPPVDADTGIPDNDFTRGQAFYNLMIEVDPVSDNIIYVGGIDLFRSSDGGTSWAQISKWSNNNNLAFLNVPTVHADHHILVFNPEDANQGVFGTDGGIYYGNDLTNATLSTSAISSRNKNYNTLQFYDGSIGSNLSSEKLIAGAQDNGSLFINNASSGVNASIRVTGGDGAHVFIDKDNEYIVTSYVYNNYFYIDYNTGAFKYTIAENDDDGDFINPAALDSDNNILYTSGNNKIYRYTLNAASATSSTMTNSLLTASPTAFKTSTFTTTTLFVGTENGKLLKLTNANIAGSIGGTVWVDITGDMFYGSISCIELGETENDIMVTFHNYGITSVYYTQDGGDTWQNKEGNLPDLPVKAILMNPLNSNEVILGTDLGVWGTSNFNEASPTWFQSQNGMKDVQVTSFDIRKSDNTVLASTYGRGMFTAKFTVDNYNDDDDNDSVINGLDLCANTPAGETVDANGCSESQIDDDNDGIMNNIDVCPNTPVGDVVDETGCSIFSLPSNNFSIETISETCPSSDNGQVIIQTVESHSYVTTINGIIYNFTGDLTVDNLAPGIYNFCITVTGETYEQCFVVEVKEGATISGKSSVTSGKATVEIEEGTAPFTIYVNGKETFETNSPIFNIDVKPGDVVEVKTAVACEGVYSKTVELLDAIVAYPNPTRGNVEIILPISEQEVSIELYNIHSQLIFKNVYSIVYGKVQLDLTTIPSGVYIAKVLLDKPLTVKIIKQ